MSNNALMRPDDVPVEPVNPSSVSAPVVGIADDATVSDEGVRRRLLAQIGTVKMSRQQRVALAAPTPDEIADVKPTGEVYVPGVHYRRKLSQVFVSWGLRPLTDLKMDLRTTERGKGRSVMYREYALIINGVAASVAMGEAEYHPSNARMTYGDAAEAVRTNALTRLCKDIGLFSDPWDRRWANEWRNKYGVQVWIEKGGKGDEDEGSNRPQWRRLDGEPYYKETGVTDDSPNQAKWRELRQARASAKGEHKPAPERRAEPAKTATEMALDAAEAAAKVLIVAVRAIKTRPNGSTLYAVKTAEAEMYTDDDAIRGGCEAAMAQQKPIALFTELREDAKGTKHRWIVEFRA